MKLFLNNKRLIVFFILLIFALVNSYLILNTALIHSSDRSLTLLASQFLHKHVALLTDQTLPLGDVANYFNNFYLYFGPFPSIMLMPFVAIFGKAIPEIIIGIFSLLASFISVYIISKKFEFNKTDSLWLCLFYVFSTVIFAAGLIEISAYQVEILGTTLVLISLAEYFTKKRPFIIGILLGLAFLTRAILILALVFYLFEFLKKRLDKVQIIVLIIPIVLSIITYGLYNQRRFHSFFETGYKYSKATFPSSTNAKYGQYNLIHIPSNLYALLILPPMPVLKKNTGFVMEFPFLKANPWGMAIWFTSPLFLVLFYKFKKGKYIVSASFTVFTILIPIITYYSIGFSEFGYRYAMDFLPFIFIILITSLNGKLTNKELLLITIGVIFNCLFITSLWGSYPLFGIIK